MQKIDIDRELQNVVVKSIESLHLTSDSLFLLLTFIFDNYRFSTKFLFRFSELAQKFHNVEIKFTPSPSGNEDRKD